MPISAEVLRNITNDMTFKDLAVIITGETHHVLRTTLDAIDTLQTHLFFLMVEPSDGNMETLSRTLQFITKLTEHATFAANQRHNKPPGIPIERMTPDQREQLAIFQWYAQVKGLQELWKKAQLHTVVSAK